MRHRPRILLAALALLAPLFAALAISSGTAPAGAIVGGSFAKQGEFPFVASMQLADGDRHFCGGSVVGERWILTAAHCTIFKPREVQVVVGKTTLSRGGGQTLSIDKMVVHPKWDETGTHDVALWHTTAPIKAPVIPIVARNEQRYEQQGADLTVIGWGTEFFQSPAGATDRLKKLDVRAVSDSLCVTNGLLGFNPATEFCAEQVLGDSCQGDSGGPIFARNAQGRPVQVGAVSYGLGCAFPGFPGVYAELNNPSIHSFLTSTMRRG